MQEREALLDRLATFAIFADLSAPELQAVAQSFEEAFFADGERVLRQGMTGGGLYVILEGNASVRIDGDERARLGVGEFFGEVSLLLGEPPVADVAAVGPLRCVVLAAPEVEAFLLAHPRVMFRMLQAQARRLRNANRYRNQ